jgi:hypothetical protein
MLLLTTLIPPPPLPFLLQPGSQHRSKAEPAGAVAGGKWVPNVGASTLMGELPGPYCRNLDEEPPAAPAAAPAAPAGAASPPPPPKK